MTTPRAPSLFERSSFLDSQSVCVRTNYFPSIRLLNKAPTLTTTTISATTTRATETATQVTAISTSTETGSTLGTEATATQPSAGLFTTETLIVGIASITIMAVGVYYLQKRRKQNHRVDK